MKGHRYGVLFLLPAALIVFMAHTSAKIPDTTSAQKDSANNASASRRARDASKWAEATIQKMSVDEKIGQLLFTTYHGELTPTDSATYAKIVHDVVDLHCGGFINVTHITPMGIEKSQAYATAVLNNQLQSKAKLPLLIACTKYSPLGRLITIGIVFVILPFGFPSIYKSALVSQTNLMAAVVGLLLTAVALTTAVLF